MYIHDQVIPDCFKIVTFKFIQLCIEIYILLYFVVMDVDVVTLFRNGITVGLCINDLEVSEKYKSYVNLLEK